MDKPRFMLDSTIVIGHLNKQLDLPAFFEAQGECEVFFNLVTGIEVLSKPDMNAAEEAGARTVLGLFTRVEIDDTARNTAILIRRAKALLLPDALIAASAVSLNATLLSNDPHLTTFVWPAYHVRAVLP